MTPGLAAYAATKGAVRTCTLRAPTGRWKTREFRLTTSNGSDRKDLNPATSNWATPQKANTALDRYGSVDEVASLVAFVAGPEPWGFYGANLTVDGGTNA